MSNCGIDYSETECFLMNAGIYVSYALIGIALLAAVGFSLVYMARNFEDAKKSLLGIGATIIILVICYFIASSEIPASLVQAADKFDVSASAYKWIGMGGYATYLLLAVAFIALIATEVKAAIQK